MTAGMPGWIGHDGGHARVDPEEGMAQGMTESMPGWTRVMPGRTLGMVGGISQAREALD
jgi:hypothetical protein